MREEPGIVGRQRNGGGFSMLNRLIAGIGYICIVTAFMLAAYLIWQWSAVIVPVQWTLFLHYWPYMILAIVLALGAKWLIDA
jgi:hypothetical protein